MALRDNRCRSTTKCRDDTCLERAEPGLAGLHAREEPPENRHRDDQAKVQQFDRVQVHHEQPLGRQQANGDEPDDIHGAETGSQELHVKREAAVQEAARLCIVGRSRRPTKHILLAPRRSRRTWPPQDSGDGPEEGKINRPRALGSAGVAVLHADREIFRITSASNRMRGFCRSMGA